MFDVYLKQSVNGRPETSRINALPLSLEDANRWSNRLMKLKSDNVAGFETIQAVFVERSDEDVRTEFLLSMMGAISEVVASQREAALRASLSEGEDVEVTASRRRVRLEEGDVEVIIYHSPPVSAPPSARQPACA